MERIYLDYAATTPLDPQVLSEMLPYFTENFGNPSSSHYFGQKAEGILESSRQKVCDLLGGDSKVDEVIFTASGSEGDNLSIRGVALSSRNLTKKDKILYSPVEHPAVMNTVRQLQEVYGFKCEQLRIDDFGCVILDDVAEKIDDHTALVSVIYANNEIGSINLINEISKICHQKGTLFHSDAVQACAHLDVNFLRDDIDLISFAAHKFYGPKGVGAIIRKRSINLIPHITGGKQEHKLRAGTQNIPGIVGLAKALEITTQNREVENQHVRQLRDKLLNSIVERIPGAHITGHPMNRLPNHASFVFEGINGNDLVIMLDMAGFACSSGSACKVGDPKPSKVLLALGIDPDLAIGSLRITLGKENTESQIDDFLIVLEDSIKKLRK